MKICSICRKTFPEEVLISFSPGGAGKIYECAECHDRACNRIDTRRTLRRRMMWATAQDKAHR